MKAEELWNKFIKEKNIDENTKYEAWKFCGGGNGADELANLVLEGKKIATTSSLIAYQSENVPLPEIGSYSVVQFDNDEAACIIQTTNITLKPFDEVDEEFAAKEGEGDLSLAYWQEVHRIFLGMDYEAINKPFDEKGICVLEEFKLIYKA